MGQAFTDACCVVLRSSSDLGRAYVHKAMPCIAKLVPGYVEVVRASVGDVRNGYCGEKAGGFIAYCI